MPTEVKSRPILYSAQMVRAYFQGIKCQTRRPRGLEKINQNPKEFNLIVADPQNNIFQFHDTYNGDLIKIKCPYGCVGDELWGKETWAVDAVWDDKKPSEITGVVKVWYAADGNKSNFVGRTRSSMFMPKWASRIHQEITGLKCQRLQDMTEADAIAEGMTGRFYQEATGGLLSCAKDVYHWYWDKLNGDRYPWSSNPWVFVLQYPRYEK